MVEETSDQSTEKPAWQDPAAKPFIQIENVSKDFDGFIAVNKVDGSVRVTFKNGGAYQADGISDADLLDFTYALNRGGYFNNVLKDRYDWVTVDSTLKEASG